MRVLFKKLDLGKDEKDVEADVLTSNERARLGIGKSADEVEIAHILSDFTELSFTFAANIKAQDKIFTPKRTQA